MHVGRIPFVLTAALVVALPTPALAKPGAHAGMKPKPGAAAPAKPAAPPPPPPPARRAPPATPSECCMPAAQEAAPAVAKGMAPCCEKTAAGNPQPCCQEHAKGKKQACCEAGAAKGDKKEACCEAMAAGKPEECCSAQKPHAMRMDGKPGMRVERRVEVRRGHGGWKRHFPDAVRYKGSELRYLPVMGASTNPYLIYARDRRMQLNDFVSLGGQTNWALQLGNAPGNGPWFVPYMGVVPRVGADLGPLRADVGALVGLGGMLRTGTVAGTDHVLQARVMWVVEPRVELGWRGEHMGVGLVGAYNLNPNQSEFGGLSAGLRMTWKRPGWM